MEPVRSILGGSMSQGRLTCACGLCIETASSRILGAAASFTLFYQSVLKSVALKNATLSRPSNS